MKARKKYKKSRWFNKFNEQIIKLGLPPVIKPKSQTELIKEKLKKNRQNAL